MTINSKYILSAAIAGFISAFAVMSAFGGGFLGLILGVASPFVLFFVAMTAGLTGTFIAVGVGFLLIAMMTPPILSAGLYLFGIATAPLILAWRMEAEAGFGPQQRLSGKFLGKTMAYITLIGGGLLALAFLNFFPALADPNGVLGAAREMFYAVIDQLAAGKATSNMDLLKLKAQFDELGPFVFSGIGSTWLTLAVINACLAGMFAKRIGRLGGLDIAQLRMPRWYIFPALGALVLSFSAGAPGLAISALMITLFTAAFFQGLSVAHGVSKGLPARGVLLTLLYLVCIFTPLKGLLAVLGLVDTRFDLRARRAGA